MCVGLEDRGACCENIPKDMNRKDRSYQPEYATKNGAAIRTMNLQVAVMRPGLREAVLDAFNLAKSSGRELDLAFTLQSVMQVIPTESGIKSAQRELP